MVSDEHEILLDFEKAALSGEYLSYFTAKRARFRQSVARFPGIWRGFMCLNEIWVREFKDLHHQRDPYVALPLQLFMVAHSHFVATIELAFSGALKEACNTLRMGIDAVYHACLIRENPALVRVWISKADMTEEAATAFTEAFEKKKRENFERLGLKDLHDHWENYSEWSHTTIEALSRSLRMYDPTDKGGRRSQQLGVAYFVDDPKILVMSLLHLLDAARAMERAMYSRFQTRLDLDPELTSKRTKLANWVSGLSRETIRLFKVAEPKGPPPPRRPSRKSKST
jgi:hypothetical protein